MTEEFFFTSSPVFTVDGEDIGELGRDVVYLCVEESVSGLKSLQARFVAIGPVPGSSSESLMYLDGRLVDFGKALRLSIGPPAQQRVIFDGVISAMEASFEEAQEPEFCLYAEDTLMDLRMTRRMKTYEDMSDADIAADIAGEHGLTPQVEVDGPTYDRIQQFNMSDLAFLRERARLLQAEVWVDGSELHFKTRDRREGAEVTLIRGTDLIAAKISADLAHQRSSVRVSGYDANDRQVIDEEAGSEAIAGEVTTGRTGIEVLQSAFGARVSHRVREVPLDAAEAADWAAAELRRRARSFVTVDAVSRGTPDLTIGSRLNLEQVGAPFNGGGYYVTHVKHTYDLTQGHRTHFEAQRPTIE